MNASFEKLVQRCGAYSLPFLVHLHSEDGSISMRFVNDTRSVEFEGKTYGAGAFSYSPNASEKGFDGGGKLEITVCGNSVIDLIETKTAVRLDVVGALDERGEIEKLYTFAHHYGSVKADRKTAEFTFNKDDRLSMTFPSLVFSTSNNRGNS